MNPAPFRPLVRVINATGVILNTNLGRAPLGRGMLSKIEDAISGYCNLEFDLDKGGRGFRQDRVKELIVRATGAEDALLVNNNAAALILILHGLARGREVIVSRGELIEIGGSFRLPEIMAAGGARLREVGTTNCTTVSDYEKAVGPDTAMILKAHSSNFEVVGEHAEASAGELSALAGRRGIPFVYDVGSGLLDGGRWPQLEGEPDVKSALEAGADLVAFSSDKLLGGPQGGIVAGKRELVLRLESDPLMRAFRVGKFTLAALNSVLEAHLSPEGALSDCPLYRFLSRTPDELRGLALSLKKLLAGLGVASRTAPSLGQAGGGSAPGRRLPSWSVVLQWPGGNDPRAHEKAHSRLMSGAPPVVGVLQQGELRLDMLAVEKDELQFIARAVAGAVKAEAGT